MRNAKYLLPIVFILLGPAPALAQSESPAPVLKVVRPFSLKLPLDCKIGADCFVLNYPDIGKANDGKKTDAACGPQTYDDHKGTDIAITDKAAMDKGVNVLAARDGTIKIVRDSVDDIFPLSAEQLAKIKTDKKECGNAVLIDHGEGWQTMYCHLKRGSITVTPQQKIKAGEKIAQVGASGMTQFPHLHLGVIKGKDVIDPFTGRNIHDACGAGGKSLFEKSAGIVYAPIAFAKKGFHDAPVKMAELDQGLPQKQIGTESTAFVFYTLLYGLRADDVVEMTIENPAGGIFAERTITQAKDRARQLLFVGRNRTEGEDLAAGIYNGKITVTRKTDTETPEIFSASRSIHIKADQ